MRKIFLLTAVLCLPSFCLAAQDCAKNAEACSASSTRAVISSASAIWSISISNPRRRAIRSPIPIDESASAGIKIGTFSFAQTEVSDSYSGLFLPSHSPHNRVNSREEPRNGAIDSDHAAIARSTVRNSSSNAKTS